MFIMHQVSATVYKVGSVKELIRNLILLLLNKKRWSQMIKIIICFLKKKWCKQPSTKMLRACACGNLAWVDEIRLACLEFLSECWVVSSSLHQCCHTYYLWSACCWTYKLFSLIFLFQFTNHLHYLSTKCLSHNLLSSRFRPIDPEDLLALLRFAWIGKSLEQEVQFIDFFNFTNQGFTDGHLLIIQSLKSHGHQCTKEDGYW